MKDAGVVADLEMDGTVHISEHELLESALSGERKKSIKPGESFESGPTLMRRRRPPAHCDVDVTMTQSSPPEGQMVILDAFADCMRRTMDLNMFLVEHQLRDASETADPPPALMVEGEPGGGISRGRCRVRGSVSNDE